LEVNCAGRGEFGSKVELHTKLLELHRHHGRDSAGSGRRSDGGVGKLTAGEKAGFRAFHHDQVRLGENRQQMLLLERLNRRADVQVRREDEEIEQIRQVQVCVRELPIVELERSEEWRLELLRGRCSESVLIPAEEIEAELLEGVPVDAGELD